jgi:hypothetical protein
VCSSDLYYFAILADAFIGTAMKTLGGKAIFGLSVCYAPTYPQFIWIS